MEGMWKLGFASWKNKEGYDFQALRPQNWRPDQKLLETVFMFALNKKERRKDARIEVTGFEGRELLFYYFGNKTKDPTVIIYEGNGRIDKEHARHLLMSLAIKIREAFYEKEEKLKFKRKRWMETVLKGGNARIAHVLSHYPRSFTYTTLLERGAMYQSEILEECEELKPMPSSLDIREYLLLLSGVTLAGFKSKKGTTREKVYPRRIILPYRKISPRRTWESIRKETQSKIKNTAKEKQERLSLNSTKNMAKEMSLIASLLLNQKVRSLFLRMKRGEHFGRREVEKLIGKEKLRQLIDEDFVVSIELDKEERIYPLFLPVLLPLSET